LARWDYCPGLTSHQQHFISSAQMLLPTGRLVTLVLAHTLHCPFPLSSPQHTGYRPAAKQATGGCVHAVTAVGRRRPTTRENLLHCHLQGTAYLSPNPNCCHTPNPSSSAASATLNPQRILTPKSRVCWSGCE
jgi:hypothetical protein